MKRKISLFLVLVLALSFVLASCGGECTEHVDEDHNQLCDDCEAEVPCVHVDAGHDALCDLCNSAVDPTYLGMGYYNTDYKPQYVDALAVATKVDELKNLRISESQGNLVLLENYYAKADENKIAVVNTDTCEIVRTVKQDAEDSNISVSIDLEEIYCYDYYGNYTSYTLIVETTTDETDKYSVNYTTKIFTALGKEIASKTAKSETYVYEENNGLFSFDGKVYSVKDDVAAYKFDKGLVSIPSCDFVTDKYNYCLNEDAVYVYDQNYKFVTSYEFPAHLVVMGGGVLADGNIVIQFEDLIPADATEYDYERVEENRYSGHLIHKYNVITTIYNVETKTATDVEIDYVFSGIANEYSTEGFTETFASGKLTNVAKINKIVDKKIDYNNELYANLGNDLRIMSYLAQEIPNQDGFAWLFDDNRFVVEDKAGKEYLINEKGEVLGEVSDAYKFIYESMLADTQKLYDSSLKLVFDESTVDYKSVYSSYYYDYLENDVYSILVDTYEVASETEGEDPEIKRDYYLFNPKNATAFTKLALTYEEIQSVRIYNNYFKYRTVASENGIDRNYEVYCNTAGAEIFRLMIDEITITAADNSSRTYTSEYVDQVVTIGESLLICVCTDVLAYNNLDGWSYTYTCTYNWYLAK